MVVSFRFAAQRFPTAQELHNVFLFVARSNIRCELYSIVFSHDGQFLWYMYIKEQER